MFKTFDENHNLVQIIYISQYQGRNLGDSTIIDLSKPNVMQIFQSRSGTWDNDLGWNLHNVNAYIVAKDKAQSSAGHLESFRMEGLMSDKEKQNKQEEIDRRKAQGIDTNSDEQSFTQLWASIQNRESIWEARGQQYVFAPVGQANLAAQLPRHHPQRGPAFHHTASPRQQPGLRLRHHHSLPVLHALQFISKLRSVQLF